MVEQLETDNVSYHRSGDTDKRRYHLFGLPYDKRIFLVPVDFRVAWEALPQCDFYPNWIAQSDLQRLLLLRKSYIGDLESIATTRRIYFIEPSKISVTQGIAHPIATSCFILTMTIFTRKTAKTRKARDMRVPSLDGKPIPLCPRPSALVAKERPPSAVMARGINSATEKNIHF